MATKANILSTIYGFITALITQAKVRSAYDAVVDELYPAEYTVTETVFNTLPNTTISDVGADSALTYTMRFKKTGSTVSVDGTIVNPTIYTLQTANLFTIAGDYAPQTGGSYAMSSVGVNPISFESTLRVYNNDKFQFLGTIQAGKTLFFSGTYNTNP